MGVVGEIGNRLEQIGRDKRGWDDSRHGNVYVGRNEERWIEIYIYIPEWVGKWRKSEGLCW